MARDNLLEVDFFLQPYEYVDDNEEEQKEIEERSRKRNGYFHRWLQEDKSIALVEDAATSETHEVPAEFITFKR